MSEKNKANVGKILSKVTDSLEKIQNEYDKIEKIGLKYQEKGKKLVEYARLGKTYVDYQLVEAPKLAEASTTYNPLFLTLDKWNISSNVTLGLLNNAKNDLNKGLEYVDKGESSVTSGTASISAEISSASSTIELINNQDAEIDLYDEFKFNTTTNLNHNILQNDLDIELDKINSDLVNRRKGAWDVFHSPSSDKKSQAANSMREILRNIMKSKRENQNL